jgi:branched-subunit amino acid transport protein
MSGSLVILAVFMAAVTYPSRAVPLFVPWVDHLPPGALAYLRLVGPACLAALVAVNTFIAPAPGGGVQPHVGVEWLAVAVAVVIVARWHNLLPGVLAAVLIVAGLRAAGLA